MSIIRALTRSLPVALSAVALACGGSGGGGGDPGTGGTTGSGGSGSGTGGNTSGTGGGNSSCRAAGDFEEVLAPTELPLGSVVRYLASDGEYVYFSGLENLYRVPAGGGEQELLWEGGQGVLYVPFFLRSDDLVVLRGTQVFSLPKEGGATTDLATLPATPYGALDGRVDFLLDGDTAYFKSESGGFGDPYELTFYSVDLTTGDSTPLATTELGHGTLIARSGDALFFRAIDPEAPESDDPVRPSALYSIPVTGGAPERVAVTFDDPRSFSFSPLGADDNDVFLTAVAIPLDDDDFGSAQASGLFRVPRVGGPATRLLQTLQLFNLQSEHHLADGRSFFRLDDATSGIYSLEGNSFEQLFCVEDLVFSIAADGSHIYLGISAADQDTSTIVRSAL